MSLPEGEAPKPASTRHRCPICGKPLTAEHAPFCSSRCADVDLNRWLGGVYVVPGRDGDLGDDIDEGEEPA